MKLSHVKIKRRRARRVPRLVMPTVSRDDWDKLLSEPGQVVEAPPPDYDEYADLNSRLQEAGLRRLLRATDRICSRHEPADAAVCSIVPESDPNPA